jgi:hypothetical protein
MNATELYLKDGRSAGVFYCEKCKIVHRTTAEADQCCMPYHCKGCGKETQRYVNICSACFNKQQDKKEAERFAKAAKITKWDGWVYVEGLGYQNGYFQSVEDLIDYLTDEEDGNYPQYAWTCSANHFVNAEISDITERIGDNAYEDFNTEDLNGLQELKAAIAKFNDANKDAVSYTPDYTTAVLIEKPKEQP